MTGPLKQNKNKFMSLTPKICIQTYHLCIAFRIISLRFVWDGMFVCLFVVNHCAGKKTDAQPLPKVYFLKQTRTQGDRIGQLIATLWTGDSPILGSHTSLG